MGEENAAAAETAAAPAQACANEEDGAEAAAPRTPKREERPAQGDASPTKTRRGEHEPTNGELLDFMRGMQASSDRRFQEIATRLDKGERRQDQLEQAMGTRLDIVEARVEDIARQNLQGMTTAEKESLDNRFRDQQEELDAMLRTVTKHTDDIRGATKAVEAAAKTQAAAAAAAVAAPASSARTGPSHFDPDVVVIAGFKPDSPRGALMAAW